MGKYDELVRRIRRRQASMRDSGEIPLSRRNDADLAADAIEALEAKFAQADEDALDRVREINELELKVAAMENTIRSWTGPVAGYAEDPARQIAIAQERIATLERERDEARIALGGHASKDFDGDEGCGCTMLGLVDLCAQHHRWLMECQTERDETSALYVQTEERLSRAMSELDEARAEVVRWQDPESPERQALQEEIIFSLGDGARSEIELREGQLEQAEAAVGLARAAVEQKESDLSAERIARYAIEMDRDHARAEVERLRAKNDELQARINAGIKAALDEIEKEPR